MTLWHLPHKSALWLEFLPLWLRADVVQLVLDLGYGTLMAAWIAHGALTAIGDVRKLVRETRERGRRRRELAHLQDYRIGPGVPTQKDRRPAPSGRGGAPVHARSA